MASRTALAISPLLSIKDWLSIALTFTVTCGVELAGLAVFCVPAEPLVALPAEAATVGVAERRVSLIWTLGGAV